MTETQAQVFERHYVRTKHMMDAFALRLAKSKPRADDLVSTAFFKAIGSFDTFDESRSFESWVFKIIQNTWYDELRRAGRFISLDNTPGDAAVAATYTPAVGSDQLTSMLNRLESPALRPLESLVCEEAVGAVGDRLNSLSDQHRACVALVDLERLDYAEAAERLQIPVGTLRSRLHRGRAILREQLKAYA